MASRKPYSPRKRSGPRKHRNKRSSMRPKADPRLKKIFARIGIPDKRDFTPDRFQIDALAAISRSDCLVAAPTGAGKTWIAEEAMAEILRQGSKAWYASPLKALSNAKYKEFCDRFGSDNVGILTGDRKENQSAALIVGTTEILRNQLYDSMHRGESPDFNLVVLDEAHYLGDPDRGVVWEEVMIYLPPRIPLLLLSATIGNPDQIAAWLETIRLKKCEVVNAFKRPVPLSVLFLDPKGTLLPLTAPDSKSKKPVIDKKVAAIIQNKRRYLSRGRRGLPDFGEILKVLRSFDLLPALFFLKSRADCDRAVDLCRSKATVRPKKRNRIKEVVGEFSGDNPHIAKHRQRRDLEKLGVGSHHSGQLPSWKLLLEQLMTEGLLDAIFATTTVAAGVNFPARTVGFLNSDRFNGLEFVPLGPTEFHQMTGRAGRRGMDKIGFALIVPGKFMDARLIATLTKSPPDGIQSQIRINFSMVLNLLLSQGPDDIRHLLAQSFAAHMSKESASRKLSDKSDHLWQHFQQHLKFLKAHGYIDDEDRLTADGLWASKLRVDQPLLIAEGFRSNIFPADNPALLAAMVAAFVNEREFADAGFRATLAPGLETAFDGLMAVLQPLTADLQQFNFEVRPLYLLPAVGMHTWAEGRPWEWVRALIDLEEGDLAMLIMRTADNLRHIAGLKETFPEVAACARRAVELIMREPVVSDYY